MATKEKSPSENTYSGHHYHTRTEGNAPFIYGYHYFFYHHPSHHIQNSLIFHAIQVMVPGGLIFDLTMRWTRYLKAPNHVSSIRRWPEMHSQRHTDRYKQYNQERDTNTQSPKVALCSSLVDVSDDIPAVYEVKNYQINKMIVIPQNTKMSLFCESDTIASSFLSILCKWKS